MDNQAKAGHLPNPRAPEGPPEGDTASRPPQLVGPPRSTAATEDTASQPAPLMIS